MYSHPSAYLKLDTHECFQKTTNDILSKLNDLETTLQSYATHSPQNEKQFHSKNYQYSSWYKEQYSGNTQPKSIRQYKYPDDSLSTLPYEKERSREENSILPVEEEYPNSELYESTYNRENSSKKLNSSELDSYIQVRSSATTNNRDYSNRLNYLLNLIDEYRDVPEKSLKDIDNQPVHSYIDVRQSATVCSRDNVLVLLPPPSTEEAAHPSNGAEVHSEVWHTGKKGFVPPKTAPVAKTRKGNALFAGRVFHQGNLIPATISPEEGLAFYSWNGKVFRTNNFEILEIHNFAWKDEGSASERLRRFPVGRMIDGKSLYLGRAYVEGRGPWVGRVHMDEKCIFIAFRGNELRIPPPYEILVTY